MNVPEIYDFDASTSTTTTSANGASTSSGGGPSSEPARPTLNEEVQQALGVLGGFWSGFRKQSATVLAGARKDLGSVVEQAQKELGKLSTPAPGSDATTTATTTTTTATVEGTKDDPSSTKDRPTSSEETSRSPSTAAGAAEGSSASNEAPTTTESESSQSTTTTTTISTTGSSSFFSFIQSSLPPTLAQNLATAPATLQSTFQRTISINPEEQLSHLRDNLSTNLANLQTTVQNNATIQQLQQSVQTNPTIQQLSHSVQNLNLQSSGSAVQQVVQERANEAGSIVKSVGEEFWRGANEFFREAVKIVPPEEQEHDGASGHGLGIGAGVGAFDGLDMWAFEDLGGDGDGEDETGEKEGKGKGRGSGEDPSLGGFAVSRTAALLKQLRSDPALLRADPETSHATEGEGETGKSPSSSSFGWFLDELEKRGGSVGSEGWMAKCEKEEGMFEELQGVKRTLVPTEMDETTFWKRYWFRAWQIKQAEEKRKALLQATMNSEEDFTWEDDDEEGTTPQTERTPMGRSTSTLEQMGTGDDVVEPERKKAGVTRTPSSPSKESEESYDLVSTRSGNASGTTLAVPGPKAVHEAKEAAKVGGEKQQSSKEEEEAEEEDEEEGEDEEEEEEGDEEDDEDSDWE